MALREDRSDTKRALAHHSSGDEYVVEYCSLWDEQDECVGTRILRAVGPVSRRELGLPEEYTGSVLAVPLQFVQALDEALEYPDLSDEDAEWLQAEEDAGRVTYPFGAQ